MAITKDDYEFAGSCPECGGHLVRYKPTGEVFHADPNKSDCSKY